MACGWYSRGYLPHFDGGEIAQFITCRLHDSLPQNVLAAARAELLSDQQRVVEPAKLNALERKALEHVLDRGIGCCALRDPLVAEAVHQNLLHWDGQRYRLHGWCVMPNHVHLLLTPLEGVSLSVVVQGFKSYTSHMANKILSRSGRFWMPDYFDRYIRNLAHYDNAMRYIEDNPVKAKLCARAEDWKWSSAALREAGGAARGPR